MQRIKVYRLPRLSTTKDLGGAQNQLFLPLANLVRVNLKLSTQLSHRLVCTRLRLTRLSL